MSKGFACWYGDRRYLSVKTTYDEERDHLNWFLLGYQRTTRVHLFGEAGAASAGASLSGGGVQGTVSSFASLGDVPLARFSIDPATNSMELAVLRNGSAVSAAATQGRVDPRLPRLNLRGPVRAQVTYEVSLVGPAATGGVPVGDGDDVLVRFSPDEPQWLRIRPAR